MAYTESDLATETLRAPGLVGIDEVPSAAEWVDVVQSNRSVIQTMAKIGLPIWNGSEIQVPEEYFVELAMRCSLPIQFKNGLFEMPAYLSMIDESERRLTIMAAPRGSEPLIPRTDQSTGRRGPYNWARGW